MSDSEIGGEPAINQMSSILDKILIPLQLQVEHRLFCNQSKVSRLSIQVLQYIAYERIYIYIIKEKISILLIE